MSLLLEVAIGRVRLGLDSDGLGWVSLIKKISGHRSSSSQSDSGRVRFWVEHCQAFLGFR
jgi:hypothetical protein